MTASCSHWWHGYSTWVSGGFVGKRGFGEIDKRKLETQHIFCHHFDVG